MKTLIVVPARFGSTRFPGKPLVKIAGRTMVSRVAAMAARAAEALDDAVSVIATDHEDIASHCRDLGFQAVMTDPDVPSGTDRALAAVEALGVSPDVIVNLQGDSPFTPPAHVTAVAEAAANSGADAATPYVRLTWQALDDFRAHKQETPFSGTTLTHDTAGRALWFSKNLIPAIKARCLPSAAISASMPFACRPCANMSACRKVTTNSWKVLSNCGFWRTA